MTFERRSSYEYGDPVFEHVAREERTDHLRATARGQRLLGLADAVVDELRAHALLREDGVLERRLIFHVLANYLYSQDAAIEIPDFSNAQSLEALRRRSAV
jgi:pyruvate formate-lyase activating enzyme-like uncharacterized protein